MKKICIMYSARLDELEDVAQEIIKSISPGDIVHLRGEMGVGKTALVRYILRIMSGSQITVRSPTFSIVEEYEEIGVAHFDFYRALESNITHWNLDHERYSNMICFVEWPQGCTDFLQEADVDIEIKYINKEKREYLLSRNIPAFKVRS